MSGIAPLAPSTDTVGPIARSVDDAALLFAVLAGKPVAPPAAMAGSRVGVLRQAFGAEPAIHHACEAAMASLDQAGVTIVDPVSLSDEHLPVAGAHIVDIEFGPAFDHYLREGAIAPGSVAAILESGAYLPDHDAALRRRMVDLGEARASVLDRHAGLRGALERLMEEHALAALLYPTGVTVPTSLDNPANGWAPELAACSGWPALSLNAGLSDDGLPIGVELLGPTDSERRLFDLARAIERALGPRPIPPPA